MVQRCIAHVDCAKETKQVMRSRVQKNRQLKFVQYRITKMRPVFTVLFLKQLFLFQRCWLVYIKCNNCCQLLNSGSTTPYYIYLNYKVVVLPGILLM